MPLNLYIIRARDFIRSTATGELDFEKSKKLLAATGKAAAESKDSEILLDFRAVESTTLSLAQVWHLVQHLYDYGPAFRHKTAILISPDAPGHRAEFFELCATNRGFRVKAFQDFEQAVYWLASAIELVTP